MASVTIGIDLAAQAADTAACVIEWHDEQAKLLALLPGKGSRRRMLDDTTIAELVEEHEAVKVGIDCPFGWPSTFHVAVHAWQEGNPWPSPYHSFSQPLRLRCTDQWVEAELKKRLGMRLTPLSPSASWLGATAMRCATLLTLLEQSFPIDRAGTTGLVVEIYPAAALALWKLQHTKYKQHPHLTARRRLAKQLASIPWLLEVPPKDLAKRGGHYIDALVAALLARLAQRGRTSHIANPTIERVEGSIHLPDTGLKRYAPFA